MRTSPRILLASLAAGAVMLTSCASYTGQTSDPNDPNRTRTGALVGAGIVPGANVRIRADTDHYEVVGLSRYDLPEKKAHVLCLDIA